MRKMVFGTIEEQVGVAIAHVTAEEDANNVLYTTDNGGQSFSG